MRFSSGRLAISSRWTEGSSILIIATSCLAIIFPPWLIDMLVETESVWTEISGLSDPRKLETPCPLFFYINPQVRLAFSLTTLQPLLPSSQVDLV